VRKKDHEWVKAGLQKIYGAPSGMVARQHAGRWKKRWQETYPQAVKCLSADIEELLTCFRFTDPVFRKAVRTTNHIERRFKEVRRRTRPMGAFSNKTSVDRILYAIFTYENKTEEAHPIFALTHKS